jgi:hypothetical protein
VGAVVVGGVEVVEQDPPGHGVDDQVVHRQEQHWSLLGASVE